MDLQEVDRSRHVVTVGALKSAREVRSEVDVLSVVHSRCEDTRNIHKGAWEGWVCGARASEVTDTDGVDEQGQ